MSCDTKELRGLAPADFDDFEKSQKAISIEIRVDPVAFAFAFAKSLQTGSSVAHEIEKVISAWGSEKKTQALVFSAAIAGDIEIPKKKQPEKQVEDFVLNELRSIGVDAAQQVTCDAGIADITTAQFVIEIKPSILTLRDANRAMGQASAYANALGKEFCIVCASEVSDSIDRTKVRHGVLLSAREIKSYFLGGNHA